MINNKYCQLILNCIKYGADDDGKITKTKLAKLVYLVDFVYFYQNLESITDLKYKKLKQGPVASEYFETIDKIYEDNSINIEKNGQAFMISLIEKPEQNELNKKELELIKKICKKWKSKNTQSIVDFTHNQLPWKISFDNQEIPYSLIIQEEECNLY